MNEDAEIRRTNLRRLKRDPNALVDLTGRGTYSYWRDLLQLPTKSFGEKAARAIESDLGLPRGWLDQVHDPKDSVPPIFGRSTSPEATLPQALLHRIAGLDPIRRKAVVASLQGTLDAISGDVSAGSSSSVPANAEPVKPQRTGTE